MFIDRAQIDVRSGKGGDGCVSFRREKFVPKGGPDGGDGGDGGSVILLVTTGIDTLQGFASRRRWQADDGQRGTSKQCHGRDGSDLIVRVPSGTLVFDEGGASPLVDLDADGKRFVVARGGKGGYGNEHFKSATNQAPRRATMGEDAVERRLRLELKLLADVGLVGMPNAGKSTLLAAVSQARPRVADYPFTTLHPHLGIVELRGDRGQDPRRLVVADIPGLIAGASEGVGLGHEFLRHVERTRVLVHLVDIAPLDGSVPADHHRTVCGELTRHSGALAVKPQIVAANKTDLLDPRACEAAVKRLEETIGRPVTPVSAATGAGVPELLEACWREARKEQA